MICRPQGVEGVGYAQRWILREKTKKYQLLQWELTKEYPGYKIVQLNVSLSSINGIVKWPERKSMKLLFHENLYA